MRHLVRQAALVHGADAVATADDAHGAACGDRLADGRRALGEGGHLEAAHGAVPDDGLGRFDRGGVEGRRFGADVQRHPVGGDLVAGHLRAGVGGELVGADVVDRQQELHALRAGEFQHLPGVVKLVELAERLADIVALRLEKGVGHAAADDQNVDLGQQVLHDGQFVGDLGAAEDRHEGVGGVLDRAAEVLDFLFHQKAGDIGLHVLADDGGRSVRAVRAAEGVVAVDVAVGGEGLGHRLLLLL